MVDFDRFYKFADGVDRYFSQNMVFQQSQQNLQTQ